MNGYVLCEITMEGEGHDPLDGLIRIILFVNTYEDERDIVSSCIDF